jgi:very-short-patch-repair endonuclease
MSQSDLEAEMALQIRAARLQEPVREYQFDTGRRWRFDFAWPVSRLALEIEGGVWTGGRHTSGAGWHKDAEKYNTAVLQGWRILRCSVTHIRNGDALHWLEIALREPAPLGGWELIAG